MERAPFEPDHGARRLAGIDGIDHQEPCESRDVRQQAQSMSAAVEKNRARRNARVALQALDGVDSHAIVRVNEVPHPQDQHAVRWSVHDRSASALFSSSSSSSSGITL